MGSVLATGPVVAIGTSWMLERMKAGIKAEHDERLKELCQNGERGACQASHGSWDSCGWPTSHRSARS